MIWEGKKVEVGQRVKVNRRNNYEEYQTGMGSRRVMRRDTIGGEGILVELSRDSVKGREMTCCIEAMRKRTMGTGGKIERKNKTQRVKDGDGNLEYEKGGEMEWSI